MIVVELRDWTAVDWNQDMRCGTAVPQSLLIQDTSLDPPRYAAASGMGRELECRRK